MQQGRPSGLQTGRAAPVGCRRAGLPAVALDSHTWAAAPEPWGQRPACPRPGCPTLLRGTLVPNPAASRAPRAGGEVGRHRVGGWRLRQLRPQEDLPPAAGIKGQPRGKNLLERRLVLGGKQRGDAHGRVSETDRS